MKVRTNAHLGRNVASVSTARKARLALAVAASVFAVQSASAQTPVNTWDGEAADGLWASANNWSLNEVPTISGGRADDVFFGTTAVAINLGTSPSAGRLNFNNPAGVTFSGNASGNGVQLRHGILMDANSPAITIPGNTNLNGTGQTYTNNSTNTLTIGSNILNASNPNNITLTVDGSGPIVVTNGIRNGGTAPNAATTNLLKTGTGSLTLNDVSTGTRFIGNVQVDNGVLLLGSSNALGSTAKTVTFNGGTISGAGASTRAIPAVIGWVLGGDVGFGGFGSGTGGGTIQIDGPTSLGGAVRTINVGGTGGGVGNLAFVGAVSSGGIIKTGPNPITSNSLSTYAGGTTVNTGALQWVNTSDISGGAISTGPFGTGTVTINNGAILRSNPSSTTKTLQNNVVINGSVTLGGNVATGNQTGPLIFNSVDAANDTLTVPATFTIGSTPILNVLAATTIANALVGTETLTKTGDAQLNLAADNSSTFTGAIDIQAGAISAQHVNALGTTAAGTTVASGAELAFGTANVNGTVNEPITISGPGITGSTTSGALTVGSNATVDIASTVNLAADATIHVTGSGTATFSGGIAGNNVNLAIRGGNGGNVTGAINLGTGSITKTQSGSWTLGAANTYSGGTTVNSGTLVVAHGDALGTGGLSIDNGGTALAQAGLPKAVSVASVATTGTGKVDLTNNALVVKSSTLTAIDDLVTAGYNNGDWLGSGITSSTAALDPNGLTAVGFFDNAEFGATEFEGVTVLDSDDVIVKYTYYGDADLNGIVDPDDFNQFLAGFQDNTLPRTWLYGDFDYNNVIDPDDFNLFLAAFQFNGAPLSELVSSIEMSSLSSADQQLLLGAVAAVPEPTSLGLLGLAAGGLLARRRRNA